MNDEAEYQRILRLYGRVVEALKGFSPSDQRLVDSEPLAIKLFFHAVSAYSLAKGTDLAPLLAMPGSIVDHASVLVLARATLESYLTFYYVFVDAKTDDEFAFRYCAWQLSGLAIRETFPAQLPENQARLAEEGKLNDDLRARIKQTDRFKKLTPKQQKAVLKGRKWRFDSWTSIASSAGIGKQYSCFLYGLLSGYAHSDSLSVLQLSQATTREDQIKLAQAALRFIQAIVSKMIITYTEKFPATREALKSDPEAASLVSIYAGALAKLK